MLNLNKLITYAISPENHNDKEMSYYLNIQYSNSIIMIKAYFNQ